MFTRRWIAVLAAVCALVATPAFGQGGNTASLSGVVTDKDGGVVPGATVVIKNAATGESNTTVTNASGAWSLPALSVGTYKVTITLTGFKTAETDVRLSAGSSNEVQTKLEVGALSEVVTVSAGTDLIRTQTPTVSSTINADFITTLPRADRNALNFLIFLPGVQTIGGAGSARSSTVSGLPQNTINITIDGISNSNLLQSGDGFFSMVVPRLDAVEEVTHDHGDGRRERDRSGCGADCLPDALGHEPLRDEPVQLQPALDVQQQQLLQPPQWQSRAAGDQLHVRRPSRWSDHHSRRVRWPGQGLLLLQLRRGL